MQKVAAYCRVSTDSNDQVNSLENQEKYFAEYIGRNPDWELVQIYVDTGITGTSTIKRVAFNTMIADAMAGKFSLILTKEISRFARNTLDSIFYTRKLKENGVGILFMNDNINTMDADAELRLTILSSIAQEESRKISDRVRWGQKRRMEQGVVFGRDMLGYDVRNGRMYVNEQGAEVVRLIFHKFVNEGKGTHVIARELREAGIHTSTYMKQWTNTVILRCLRNEKFCGDLIQKKTITPNYLDHKKKYNRGEEDFVIIRNHHEPIISRELFERAQQELKRRAPSAEQKSRHSNRYCFSGKIKCAACGSSFISRRKKRKDGSVYKAWRCYRAAVYGSLHIDKTGEEVGCNCPSVNEEDVKQILQQIVGSLSLDQDSLYKALIKMLEAVTADTQTFHVQERNNRAMELTGKKERLLELYLSEEITKEEYLQMKEKYEKKLVLIHREKTVKENDAPLQEPQGPDRISIYPFISGLVSGNIWDDSFYRNILDTIIIGSDHSITVSLSIFPYKWRAVVKE